MGNGERDSLLLYCTVAVVFRFSIIDAMQKFGDLEVGRFNNCFPLLETTKINMFYG